MGETVCVHFPDELLDEMESRIEASFDHEDRSQFVRASVRRMLAEPGEVDFTAGRKI
jgi:Arc/MetJ-type ribon-helix-helix transcriptional regulator